MSLRASISWLVFAPVLLAACAGEASPPATDLGEFPSVGKADIALTVDVPFEAPAAHGDEPGHGSLFTFRTCGALSVTTVQDRSRSWERLQLVAESPIYRRRSWRGRAPHVEVPSDRADGECVDYQLEVLNWGAADAFGVLHVTTVPPSDAGVEVVFNTPDDPRQEDPAGQLRSRILDAIQSAEHTLDMAVYGLDDPAIVEAICNAVEAGVNVRVVTDDTSEDPDDSRSYYPFLFGPDGVAGCGAQVEGVRSTGLMHHKFLLVDGAEDNALLVTGSTNLTTAGLEHNHNHMVFLRGAPELFEAYQQEMNQLLRHCASQRLDERSCAECTPSCVEGRSDEGPFMAGDVEARVYFSLSDDPLRVLRGAMHTVRMDTPDPSCGAGSDCICRISGSRYSCDYCAEGADGYGLIGQATSRIAMTMYSSTDQCFALGLANAAERGVEVTTIWDFVKAGSRYSRDDFMCAAGVDTYITNWGGGSAQVRNHNKTVVVDDIVFDGSMNLSASGVLQNNENSLVLRGAGVADTFADYVQAEVAQLEATGVSAQDADICRCRDLVDNDGDGLFDADDPDCDRGL